MYRQVDLWTDLLWRWRWLAVVLGTTVVGVQTGAAVKRGYSTSVPRDIVDLLRNGSLYNRHASPTQDMEVPTLVNISMYIEGISSFKAETMDFHVDIYFQLRWVDQRLRHNQTKRVLIKDMALFELMWHPDLYFANAKLASFHHVTAPNYLVWIYSNGSIYYDCRISLTVMCMQNLAKYPLDSQSCTLRILSYAYDVDQLLIRWVDVKPIEQNDDITMADMHLTSIIQGLQIDTYATGNWSCATAQFNVQREIMHHVLQSYVPTALIVVISWFSFWLDVDAVPGRVSLSITTLLTLATQASAARLSLPQVSYIKAIDTWMGTCMGFVFGVMIEFTFVNYWTRRKGPVFPSCTCPFGDKLKNFYGGGGVGQGGKQRRHVPRCCQTQPQNRNFVAEIEAEMHNLDREETLRMERRENQGRSPNIGGGFRNYGMGMEQTRLSDVSSPIIAKPSVLADGRPNTFRTSRLFSQDEASLVRRHPTLRNNHDNGGREAELLLLSGGDNGAVGMADGNCTASPPPPSLTAAKTLVGEVESWRTGLRKLHSLRRWKNRKVAQGIDQKSRWLFPLAFILFNTTYWIYYLYIA